MSNALFNFTKTVKLADISVPLKDIETAVRRPILIRFFLYIG